MKTMRCSYLTCRNGTISIFCHCWKDVRSHFAKHFPPNGNKFSLSKLPTETVKMPLGLLPMLQPIKLISLMIAGVLHAINKVHLSLLSLLQLLPSIVAPRLRKHNVRTARRSRSVVLQPWVTQSRGRSRDPGSVFGQIITNRKSLQASHTGPLPPFVYRGVELNSQRQSCTSAPASTLPPLLWLVLFNVFLHPNTLF